MIRIIKRFSRLTAMLAFFTIFLLNIDPSDLFDPTVGCIAFVKGFGAAVLVWVVAFVLSDILFKGVVEDISLQDVDVLDEGLLQQVREQKERMKPEGQDAVGPGK